LYVAVVAQARRPEFYLRLGVPDTVDGRFDLICLHAFLLLRRLKASGRELAGLSQAVFDIMFADMDQNLRELGVGDMTIGRKVKTMAKAFYGRIAAYEEGLAASGPAVLDDALRRNLFRKAAPADAAVTTLATYVRRAAADLSVQSDAALRAGHAAFGPPPGSATP
jgi:cytochrome b pre-mRNA-processing protein 3